MENNANKRILKNTGLLYIRTFFTMIVGFYTSRVILNTLGVNDFGIWNVVAGFVSMFAILTSSLTAAIQRFLTIELGKKNYDSLNKYFSTSVIILSVLCIIVIIIAESFGLWFVNNSLVIGDERIFAANIVYQSSILCFVLSLLSIPYGACIIANEKMGIYAYISIIEVILKLLAVISLQYLPYDKLIAFSILTLLISLITRINYGLYCKKKFSYSKVKFTKDKNLYKSMSNFAGWSFIGHSARILMGQGINILFNQFFGLALNAARGIAVQIENAIYNFVMNFTMSIVPQITKSYATANYDRMKYLILRGACISYFLMWLFSLPIIIETKLILDFWLKEYPNYTISFVRMTLLICLCRTLANTLESAINSTGRIKYYQIIVGGINLMILPICYILFQYGMSPMWGYWIILIINIITIAIKAIILSKLIDFNFFSYIKDVLIVVLITSAISIILPYYLHISIKESFLRLIIVGFSSIISNIIFIYLLGLKRDERAQINHYIKNKFLSKPI